MKRTIAFAAIIFSIAVNGNLHSAGNESGITPRVTPEDFYCGFDTEIKECTWVLEGSVCIAYDDCKPLVEKPEDLV